MPSTLCAGGGVPAAVPQRLRASKLDPVERSGNRGDLAEIGLDFQ